MAKALSSNLAFGAMLLTVLGTSCKKTADSEVSATTSINGRVFDLTTYTAAGKAEFATMKTEIKNNGFSPNSYDGFKANLTKAQVSLKHGTLTEEEIVALKVYISDNFPKINDKLRANSGAEEKLVGNLVKTIASAANKLGGGPCTVFRGVRFTDKAEKFINEASHVAKMKLIDSAFFSTTRSEATAKNYALPESGSAPGWIFVIKAKHCHDISFVWGAGAQISEVLFTPGSEFQITSSTAATRPADAAGRAGLKRDAPYIIQMTQLQDKAPDVFTGPKKDAEHMPSSSILGLFRKKTSATKLVQTEGDDQSLDLTPDSEYEADANIPIAPPLPAATQK
ncbi:MAG: hypothetical protein H7249_19185 [Chitinophagaceae bacterium]|nr:hypothetical protein [Oligoflexus sp.]